MVFARGASACDYFSLFLSPSKRDVKYYSAVNVLYCCITYTCDETRSAFPRMKLIGTINF